MTKTGFLMNSTLNALLTPTGSAFVITEKHMTHGKACLDPSSASVCFEMIEHLGEFPVLF